MISYNLKSYIHDTFPILEIACGISRSFSLSKFDFLFFVFGDSFSSAYLFFFEFKTAKLVLFPFFKDISSLFEFE